MKVIDYHEAIFASELTTNAKITALAISKYYNWKENKMCWPSNKTLAKATSLSIRSVVRAKNELVNAGYLVSHRRFNDSSVYKTTTPSHTVAYLVTESSTNNELNNELNNEKSSIELLDINILSPEEYNKLSDSMSW
jgi:DNA-binding transcriptional MocR family regulator